MIPGSQEKSVLGNMIHGSKEEFGLGNMINGSQEESGLGDMIHGSQEESSLGSKIFGNTLKNKEASKNSEMETHILSIRLSVKIGCKILLRQGHFYIYHLNLKNT